MRFILVAFLLLAFFPGHCGAAVKLEYKTYDPKTKEVENRFYVTVKEQPAQERYVVDWLSQEGKRQIKEQYILDSQHQTLWWHVFDPVKQTDYTGERQGAGLIIQGKFNGRGIRKSIHLDERPFYYNPKFGLTDFVLSGERECKFWGFRQDELKEYPMKAVRKGVETIMVQGQPVQAVRVDWTLDDFRSAFFKRTYWFRAQDGLYLKQLSGKRGFRELVKEEVLPEG